MEEGIGIMDVRGDWNYGWKRGLELWMEEGVGIMDGRGDWNYGWKRGLEL